MTLPLAAITNLTREVSQIIRDLEADVSWEGKRQIIMEVDLVRLKAAFDAVPDVMPSERER